MRSIFLLASLLGALLPIITHGAPATEVAQPKAPLFKVIAFYTGINDVAHVSFCREANKWFPQMALEHNFSYESTTNWNNLNAQFLSQYQVVIFLDTRPENSNQRDAFRQFMENGGGFFGFHFAAFALTPSTYPQNWNWYHNDFLGAGQYVSNTWKPTTAVLNVEKRDHPATQNINKNTFTCSVNEWYRWEKDLRQNSNIDILMSINDASFPLGTNPSETWYSGYYPVVWSNKNYKMIYMNMGHNDIDYSNGNADLSSTFDSSDQNKLIIDGLKWMGGQ